MPPRPFPVGSSGPVKVSDPPDVQMMAIQYTIGMVGVDSVDPDIDKAYLDEVTKKLATAAKALEKGKVAADPVKRDKGDRKLLIEVGKGCDAKAPAALLAQRAGSNLARAYDAGVLVVACHDERWECNQSTRDPDDVLCFASPRR
jgi:hypothetical protein